MIIGVPLFPFYQPPKPPCAVCEGRGHVTLYGFNCNGKPVPNTTTRCPWCAGQ